MGSEEGNLRPRRWGRHMPASLLPPTTLPSSSLRCCQPLPHPVPFVFFLGRSARRRLRGRVVPGPTHNSSQHLLSFHVFRSLSLLRIVFKKRLTRPTHTCTWRCLRREENSGERPSLPPSSCPPQTSPPLQSTDHHQATTSPLLVA